MSRPVAMRICLLCVCSGTKRPYQRPHCAQYQTHAKQGRKKSICPQVREHGVRLKSSLGLNAIPDCTCDEAIGPHWQSALQGKAHVKSNAIPSEPLCHTHSSFLGYFALVSRGLRASFSKYESAAQALNQPNLCLSEKGINVPREQNKDHRSGLHIFVSLSLTYGYAANNSNSS